MRLIPESILREVRTYTPDRGAIWLIRLQRLLALKELGDAIAV